MLICLLNPKFGWFKRILFGVYFFFGSTGTNLYFWWTFGPYLTSWTSVDGILDLGLKWKTRSERQYFEVLISTDIDTGAARVRVHFAARLLIRINDSSWHPSIFPAIKSTAVLQVQIQLSVITGPVNPQRDLPDLAPLTRACVCILVLQICTELCSLWERGPTGVTYLVMSDEVQEHFFSSSQTFSVKTEHCFCSVDDQELHSVEAVKLHCLRLLLPVSSIGMFLANVCMKFAAMPPPCALGNFVAGYLGNKP